MDSKNSTKKETRSLVLRVRLTLVEQLELTKQSRDMGYRNLSLYVRYLLFRRSISTQNFREKTIRFYTHYEQNSQTISALSKLLSEEINALKNGKNQPEILEDLSRYLANLCDVETSIKDEIELLNSKENGI